VRQPAVDAVLLDAGNTLIGMDLELLAGLAGEAGVVVTVDRLARAEAAARPTVSRFLATASESTEAGAARGVYLRAMLAALGHDLDLDALVPRLAEAVRRVPTVQLWSQVLPGVPEALARLRAAGLRLVVVSNADGTVEEGLTRAGLRARLDVIVDSFLVGAEKPDPRIFTHALAEAGTTAARAVHVGDLYAVDVLGARSAGIEGVLLDPYGDWHDVDCARFVDLSAFAAALLGGTS
jgi:putative hydrolase of the HAD superfamily